MEAPRTTLYARYYRILYGDILGSGAGRLSGRQWSKLLRASVLTADEWERRWWDHLVHPVSLAIMLIVYFTLTLLRTTHSGLSGTELSIIGVMLFIAAALQQAMAWHIFHHRLKRRLRITANLLRYTSICIDCGYDRIHLPAEATHCPECGTEFSSVFFHP